MGRTVYCRWCYERGHNRRTCPEYTERLKERAENEVENNKGRDEDCQDTYSQVDYANRIKADKLLDGRDHEREKQGSGVGTRRCSYCGCTGHNRRTCDAFGEAKKDYVSDAVAYRKVIAKTLPKEGIGIGTLMTIEPRYGSGSEPNRNHLYMVISFDWDMITHKTGTDGYRAIQLKSLDVDEDGSPFRGEHIPFPKPYNHEDDPDVQDWQREYANTDKYWEKIKVVSKVDAKIVDKIIPSNWYNAKNIEKSEYFKNYFKDARSKDYWDNFHEY